MLVFCIFFRAQAESGLDAQIYFRARARAKTGLGNARLQSTRVRYTLIRIHSLLFPSHHLQLETLVQLIDLSWYLSSQ